MGWFINNWELLIGLAVALLILWKVYFKQGFESNGEREEFEKKLDKPDQAKKDMKS
ncbi:MAG: hypothetical protein PHP51_01805 [Desulfotomaculaceae bacterium]|nr:hypothetical protein [Desulfotomaculaceae bacterium]MDD4766274.1 hypothetical protein [Desulfotomaculaceae bacterium]